MGLQYDDYLKNHVRYVQMAFDLLTREKYHDDLIDILPDLRLVTARENIYNHDLSKYTSDEYDAYNEKFYGKNPLPIVKTNFKYAWLHHIHHNPHHWQYWVLIQDNGVLGQDSAKMEALDMPDEYIIEMICDWWSFSLIKYYNPDTPSNTSDLLDIMTWYNDHIDSIILSKNTRDKVEKLLDLIEQFVKNLESEKQSLTQTSY